MLRPSNGLLSRRIPGFSMSECVRVMCRCRLFETLVMFVLVRLLRFMVLSTRWVCLLVLVWLMLVRCRLQVMPFVIARRGNSVQDRNIAEAGSILGGTCAMLALLSAIDLVLGIRKFFMR